MKLNGIFKIIREVAYVMGFIIALTLAWSNLTHAVENNYDKISEHTDRIEKLEEQAQACSEGVGRIEERLNMIWELMQK